MSKLKNMDSISISRNEVHNYKIFRQTKIGSFTLNEKQLLFNHGFRKISRVLEREIFEVNIVLQTEQVNGADN